MVKVTIIFGNKYYTQPGRSPSIWERAAEWDLMLMETNLPLLLKTNGKYPFSYSSLKSLHRLSPVEFSLEDLQFAYLAAAPHTHTHKCLFYRVNVDLM